MDLVELRTNFPRGLWLLDTEYATPPGDPVIPVCVVGREFFSGRTIRQFFELDQRYDNPFPAGHDALFVAYAAHAEWSCFLSLGWDLPVNIIDLYAEFRNEISGRTPPAGRVDFDTRLLGALSYHNLDSISALEKLELQKRIGRGHPFSAEERQIVLDYCESDVRSLQRLLPAMAPMIELPYGLFRGRYTKAVAHIERCGIPVDRETYDHLIQNRGRLKSALITDFELHHGPSPYLSTRKGIQFSFAKLQTYLEERSLLSAWYLTPKGRLKTSDEYLQKMARRHPVLRPLADLVKRIGDLRQFDLKIGSDGRSRYATMPFKAGTGRNQPKASQFLFAQSSWTRSFVKPAAGCAVGYVDWSAAEFAIAAALSSDPAMRQAYQSGDPYMRSAISMGFAPAGATKATHGTIRDLFKVWLLAAQYGVGASALVNSLPFELAQKVPNPDASAEEFLEKHQQLFTRYWRWAEARVEIFLHETRVEETLFGWRHHFDSRLGEGKMRKRSLNFPMQATCAEILRWACIYATEENIEVQAPVHDALLVGGSVTEIEDVVQRTRACMDRASSLVLGLTMRTDAKVIRHPDRFMDPRGAATWDTIRCSLKALGGAEPSPQFEFTF